MCNGERTAVLRGGKEIDREQVICLKKYNAFLISKSDRGSNLSRNHNPFLEGQDPTLRSCLPRRIQKKGKGLLMGHPVVSA